MKQIVLSASVAMLSFFGFSQAQIGNSDFENWEAVSQGEEPVNWNSFMTAQGSLIQAAGVQVAPSSVTRPGSTGTTSARIWSRDAGFSIVANGNLTLGRINMGSVIASSPNNHNISLTNDPDFSEAITDSPDSIVFWANYTAASSSSEARMKATLHDNNDYRDPEDTPSEDYIVATAELNYSPTGGWVRMAVPFVYSGPATNPAFLLVTFASNATPGGGAANDSVLIDDVELIYSSTSSLSEENAFPVNVIMNNDYEQLHFQMEGAEAGRFEVYDMTGARILTGETAPSVAFDVPSGIYIVNVLVGNKSKRFKVYHQ